MKKYFFILVIACIVTLLLSCHSDSKTIWVLDTEHVLTEKQIASLDSLYKAHEKITSNEIALVTASDYGTDTTIHSFALNFGKKYGIGKNEKNNGIIIAFSKANRAVSIATGYGTEKVLTNEIAKQIIDSVMTPNFKDAKIFEGLWEGSKAIIKFLEKPENSIK